MTVSETAASESPPITPSPAVPAQEINLGDPALYLNRELTWLEFNRRVLREADDERTPLLERVKFLAIVSNNLDEFFMKRIGGLKQQIGAGVTSLTVDGRSPLQQVLLNRPLVTLGGLVFLEPASKLVCMIQDLLNRTGHHFTSGIVLWRAWRER